MQKRFSEEITSPAASKKVTGRVRKSRGGGKEETEEAEVKGGKGKAKPGEIAAKALLGERFPLPQYSHF